MDKIDTTILKELQKDADRKIHELEKTTRIPRSTIHNRIQKLKKEGIISRTKAVVDSEKIGLPVTAMVHMVLTSEKSLLEIARKVALLPNVEEVFAVAGEFDIIVKVKLPSNKELGSFMLDTKSGLKMIDGVERTESMIVIDTIHENGILTPSQ